VSMGDAITGTGTLSFERAVLTVAEAGSVLGLAVACVHSAFVQAFAGRADQLIVLAVVDEIVLAEDALHVPLYPADGVRTLRIGS